MYFAIPIIKEMAIIEPKFLSIDVVLQSFLTHNLVK